MQFCHDTLANTIPVLNTARMILEPYILDKTGNLQSTQPSANNLSS